MQYQSNLNLDKLFDKLKDISEKEQRQAIEKEIWQIWLESKDQKINAQMQEGIEAINQKRYNDAIACFSEVIKQKPSFVEAWNRRATAYYLRGSYKKSIDDVKQTLTHEPRHFAALSGLISMYMLIGNFRGALKALRKLAEIYPKDEEIRTKIKMLENKLSNEGGQS